MYRGPYTCRLEIIGLDSTLVHCIYMDSYALSIVEPTCCYDTLKFEVINPYIDKFFRKSQIPLRYPGRRQVRDCRPVADMLASC